MIDATLELRGIARQYPGLFQQEIDSWIDRNIKEVSIDVSMDDFCVKNSDHRRNEIEQAQHSLAIEIVKLYNRSPEFWKSKTKPYFTCTMRAFILKP